MVNPSSEDQNPQGAKSKEADFLHLEVLKTRADFLRAARGARWGTKGMMVQGFNRGDDAPVRIGFTCSKKVGNAVARNRAKRRLREVARAQAAEFKSGWDYVLIGKKDVTATRGFEELKGDLVYALKRIHSNTKSN